VKITKRYIFLLFIIPLLTNCGAGGGGGAAGNPIGGNDNTSNKPNPACSSQSSLAKIKVNKDGIYKVAYLDLYNACVDLLRVDPAALKMTHQGDEIAIDVIDNNQNGHFDDGDSIEFYGKAISRSDSRFRFTETNVYWLSAEAGGARKRIAASQGNSKAFQGAASFLKTLHKEEDTRYEQKNYPEATPTDNVREHWFWGDAFYGEEYIPVGVRSDYKELYVRDYNFDVMYAYLDKSKSVSLTLHMQSVSGSHRVKVYVNDHLVGDQTWANAGPFDLEVSGISSSFLVNGSNKLTIESVGVSSTIEDFFYLDWFEVGYYHTYYAEYDMLEFTGDGLIGVSNFSTSNDISVYEISDDANVVKMIPVKTEWTPSDSGKVVFSNPRTTEGKFLALSGANKKIPVVEAHTPVDLKAKEATYLIITHGDFYDAITSLADYRSGQGGGYNTLIVKVNDIYDEFGYGIETPQAIKDFLRYAHENWLPGPQYVLLVGDATIDYKDISGYGISSGVKSYVPAYLYNYSGLGEVPSDNWFVDVSGDVLPEMSIGRIPAKSPADVTAVVNKIISHETSFLKSDDVVLVADYNMVSGALFEDLSDSLAGLVPSSDYFVTKLYQTDYPDSADMRGAILSEINGDPISRGPLIVNYTGHGSVVNWTTEDVFSSEDIAYLTNKSYPFVVALNCLNGYFVLPDDGVEQGGVQRFPSIGEAFLLAPEKGALGVLAASSIGYPSEHDPLAQALYNIVFNQDVTLGEAVTKAKEGAYKEGKIIEDVVETFIFFGDPATKLR